MVHLDGLDLSGDVRGRERDDHAGLDDTSLDTADGHRTDTTDLVDILKGETEGLVGGTDGGLNRVNRVEESLALDHTSLRLLSPALVPRHATQHAYSQWLDYTVDYLHHLLGGLLQHVVAVPAGDGNEADSLRVVANLLDEGGRLLDDFVEAVLAPLQGTSIT